MRRYKYTKKYEWSHDLAYVAGLIASDGCLYNDRRHINLTSKDIEQLETFTKILKLKFNLKQKPNGFGGMGYYVQFSDVALYDFLYESGIKPAKSHTIKSVSVPEIFYADFLRGYFDGDGTVYGFWDKRWRSSLMYYTEFVSASLEFLEWIQSMNSKMGLTTKGRIKLGTRAFVLSYAKQDSKKLFKLMYYDLGLPMLVRKHNKFVAFLRLDPYAGKEFARVVKSVNTPV
jgi:hypothetical protein